MVTLKNVGGAVRVVFDINRKPHVIPPTGEVKLMLSEPSLKRFAKAAEKGDTLLVIDVDYQPLEEPVQPEQPATNGHSEPPVAAVEQPATPAPTAATPAPEAAAVAAATPAPRPNRRQRRQGVDRNG